MSYEHSKWILQIPEGAYWPSALERDFWCEAKYHGQTSDSDGKNSFDHARWSFPVNKIPSRFLHSGYSSIWECSTYIYEPLI